MVDEESRRSSPERRQRILDAARQLILKQGLRATTMEAIARSAKVAKPTLYAYFSDKEAVFAALVGSVGKEILSAFDAALAGREDTVERIGAALAAKYGAMDALLQGSPHAAELYSEHDRVTGTMVSGLDGRVEQAITQVLADAGVAKPKPVARMLLASAFGLSVKMRQSGNLGPALGLLAERIIRPEL